jgi:L-asparagine transporter-like permease
MSGSRAGERAVSTFGLGLATALAAFYPRTAYVYMFGIALFGGLFVWLMIFITHLRFRPRWERETRRDDCDAVSSKAREFEPECRFGRILLVVKN